MRMQGSEEMTHEATMSMHEEASVVCVRPRCSACACPSNGGWRVAELPCELGSLGDDDNNKGTALGHARKKLCATLPAPGYFHAAAV